MPIVERSEKSKLYQARPSEYFAVPRQLDCILYVLERNARSDINIQRTRRMPMLSSYRVDQAILFIILLSSTTTLSTGCLSPFGLIFKGFLSPQISQSFSFVQPPFLSKSRNTPYTLLGNRWSFLRPLVQNRDSRRCMPMKMEAARPQAKSNHSFGEAACQNTRENSQVRPASLMEVLSRLEHQMHMRLTKGNHHCAWKVSARIVIYRATCPMVRSDPDTTSSPNIENAYLLVLDGAQGTTCKTLNAQGISFDRILVPNVYTHVVASLRKIGVVSYCCDIEDVLNEWPETGDCLRVRNGPTCMYASLAEEANRECGWIIVALLANEFLKLTSFSDEIFFFQEEFSQLLLVREMWLSRTK
eukprot:767578-Hanusia_phi.AAC.2